MNWRMENSLLAFYQSSKMCYNSTNLSDGVKVVEYVHTFVK